ncbi:MAG: ABC transporter permease [Liquorilactobacillus ghanensis]|jgi:ABC-2 type transport system permease protein|uniref:ABC superfamily ATP binding cassette transporter, membrane protein n=2 Tax=Liquorilactobacillus ghanensis TaxID=399370 RepID=A0A0R1VIG3_9LACO|nr:ABC transporter permease [Liquorilactobacillus ghanensis]KRM05234.1 hypothetical protein FC89_GL001704 [Liquorilactobacillus ghanensis DSM 18630]
MLTLVQQELFKLVHKKSTWILAVLQLVLMIVSAVLGKNNSDTLDVKSIFISGFGGLSWIVFIMIVACSSAIAMEFQYGTIKELLYRRYSRGMILVSKWLTMLIYSIVYYVATFLISIILQLLLFSSDFSLSDTYQNNHSYLAAAGLTYLGNFIILWLLLSLVLLLANIFKTTAAAITVGIIAYFATSIISSVMFALMTRWEWLKWNPFNMLHLPSQMLNGKIFKILTLLSTPEMVIGNLVYIAIFLGLGFLVFRRRNV